MVKMFKIELYAIPLNILEELIKTPKDLKEQIKYGSLKNDCLLKFGTIEVRDIGKWRDDIKFNFDTPLEEYRKVFEEKK